MGPVLTPLNILTEAAFGFVVAGVAGLILLPILRRLQLRQKAYEDAPQTHQVKSGTPTMGGLVFVVAFACALFARDSLFTPLILLVIACAGVGFVDDYLAIRQGTNRGLRARTKFLATALIAVVFLRAVDGAGNVLFPRDVIFHSGSFMLIAPHWLWLLLGILAITGTIHAVNLTDGLDGLATGCVIPALAAFAGLGLKFLMPAAVYGASVGVGACFAFLLFNRHPAKMFMGDTGSLALGALLAGVAILTGEMLLLIVIGGVFVAEALSVIAQVTYFKLTQGKRILRMSPLHHHFELGGWPETKVTAHFWIASLLCSILGIAIVR
jgi:phospho-N-acetylmuramoyl-pentapeptide-transferase